MQCKSTKRLVHYTKKYDDTWRNNTSLCRTTPLRFSWKYVYDTYIFCLIQTDL